MRGMYVVAAEPGSTRSPILLLGTKLELYLKSHGEPLQGLGWRGVCVSGALATDLFFRKIKTGSMERSGETRAGSVVKKRMFWS